MERDKVKEFLYEILPTNTELKDIGEWVSAPCPLAAFTHEKGTDSNPSFGIKVNDLEHSVFNCLTCHSKGTLKRLLQRLAEYTGENYDGMIEDADVEEFIGGELPEWDNRIRRDTNKDVLGEPVDEEYLFIYDEAGDHPYLRSRGVGPKTSAALDLRVDPDNKGEERILFPVYSLDGGFHGYTGRSTHADSELRVRDYFGLKKRLLLLGSEFIEPKQDAYVMIVEGLFDFGVLFGYGLPVLGAMHAGLTDQQADIIKDIGLPTYCFQDNDKAGREGTQKIKEQVGDHVPVMQVRYPDREVWDEGRQEYRPIGDPAELTKAEVLWMITDARLA